MTNLVRKIRTKFYHNRLGFVDCISKNILVCFFGPQSIYIDICLRHLFATRQCGN